MNEEISSLALQVQCDITDEMVMQAAFKAMRSYNRSWVTASDIYLELIPNKKTSKQYYNRQNLIDGRRIYLTLRKNGFVREISGSKHPVNPRYNYIGGESS